VIFDKQSFNFLCEEAAIVRSLGCVLQFDKKLFDEDNFFMWFGDKIK